MQKISSEAHRRRAVKRTLREPALQDALDGPADEQAQRMLVHMTNNGADNIRSVLHLGSGTGRLINAMAQRLPAARFTGIEWHEPLVTYAQQTYPGHHFVLADARRMNLRRRFDVILCLCTPHLAHTDEPIMRRIYTQHSQPGTVLVLRVAMVPVERRSETWREVQVPSGGMSIVRTRSLLYRRNRIRVHRRWESAPPVDDRYDLRITDLRTTVAALQRRGFAYESTGSGQVSGQVQDGTNARLLAFRFQGRTADSLDQLHPSQEEEGTR